MIDAMNDSYKLLFMNGLSLWQDEKLMLRNVYCNFLFFDFGTFYQKSTTEANSTFFKRWLGNKIY